MSNKQRWPAASARKVADELVAELATRCERLEIAGSLRRGKVDVGDIEILYIPKIGQVRKPGNCSRNPAPSPTNCSTSSWRA